MPKDYVILYLGPSPLAKVLETFVPEDYDVLHVGPSPLAKVLETFVPKDYDVLYVGPSPLAKVYWKPLCLKMMLYYIRAFALGQSVGNLCA